MKRTLQAILLFLALACICVMVLMRLGLPDTVTPPPTVALTAESVSTPPPTAAPTPTPPPTPTPEPEYYTISVVGDCTLASHQLLSDQNPKSFAYRMSGDYGYPFANTVQYFADDDFTIANLECTFSDRSLYSYQYFYFQSPTDWAQILIEGSVEFVTTANNHMQDFGSTGAEDTYDALDKWQIAYGKENETRLYTTESGLKVGVYCASRENFSDGPDSIYTVNKEKALAAIQKLKADGAEYIICAFHWGKELKYHPYDSQIDVAHACIDAGADLIYGSHTHCLQPIEEYNGGIILYSMGNWSFGGNTNPSDWDTALVQLRIKRDIDGTVANDGFSVVPCCCSESKVNDDNDYKPTPYEEGTEAYERIISKLDGSYAGGDGNVDYSGWLGRITG